MSKMSFNNYKWLNNSVLLIIMVSGIFMSLSSKNLFMIWFGLEINMFGIMPFILLNSNKDNKTFKIGLYYFIVQVLGSLLFSWGSVMGNKNALGLMGLLMKMGVSPFFWWVPPVFNRLDWFSMLMLSSMQKTPVLLLIRLCFDISFLDSLFLCLSGLLVSTVGINFSSSSFKSLLAWSSMAKMSLILLLLTLYMNLGLIYFLCYLIIVTSTIFFMKKTKKEQLKNKMSNPSSMIDFKIMSFFMLVSAGLPPLLGFASKVYFFSGISFTEMDMMLKQMKVIAICIKNHFVLEYPMFSSLGSWKIKMIFSIILIFQVMAYIKVFMNIYISSTLNLNSSSRKTNLMNYDSFFMFIVIMCFMPLLFL